MKGILAFLLFFLFLTGTVTGQVFRFRLGANSGAFLGEPGGAENPYPMKDELTHPGSSGFSPLFYPGAELEITTPLTTDAEFGLQFGYNRFSGHTPTAPFYNFFFSRQNPLPENHNYPDEELLFDSRVLSALTTARWFFLSYEGSLNFFMKLFGGVAFTGTDFTFRDPRYSVEYDVGVLYATGTRSSEDPKSAGFNGGGGLGTTFRLSDEVDICLDATVSFIHSDILNGVPNYDYSVLNDRAVMRRVACYTAVAQASIGIIFSVIPDRRYRKDNITRAIDQDKTLFEKRSRKRPYSKWRQR